MPTEALSTVKRKFTRILDSISNNAAPKSTTALDPPPATKTPSIRPGSLLETASERAPKRIKSYSALSASISSRDVRDHGRVGSVSSLSDKARAGARDHDSTPQDPPNFSPWSQDLFLQRLRTFSGVTLWHPKPDALNEAEWAKRGWVCVAVNTVACKGGCEKRVVVNLDEDRPTQGQEEGEDEAPDDDESLKGALVRNFETLIIEGHADSCLWRKAGCRDDIYRLGLVRPAIWQPALRARYQSLLEIHASFSNAAIEPLDTNSDPKNLAPERLLQDLPAAIVDPAQDASDVELAVKVKALSIALHGWRGSTEYHSDLLNCDACFQRIGLWMYQPDYRRPRISSPQVVTTKEPGPWGYSSPPSQQAVDQHEGDHAAQGKDGETSEADIPSIDLVEMHRQRCPYRNARTQSASGTLAGMNASQILHRVVSTYVREQRRRSDEQRMSEIGGLPAVLDEAITNADEGSELGQTPILQRAEIERLDKERETKLRRLKNVFAMKRKSAHA